MPKKLLGIVTPTTLGEHIRKVRLERKEQQQEVAKILNVNQMYLSSWEHNRKPVHPKYVESVVDYLGYVPDVTGGFDRLGTRTKLFRMKHGISHGEFLHMANIEPHTLHRIEVKKWWNIDVQERERIIKALEQADPVLGISSAG